MRFILTRSIRTETKEYKTKKPHIIKCKAFKIMKKLIYPIIILLSIYTFAYLDHALLDSNWIKPPTMISCVLVFFTSSIAGAMNYIDGKT